MEIVNKRSGKAGKYVGRPSPLGNPFVVGRDGDRETVILKFSYWLADQIRKRNPQVLAALRELNEGSVLVCWCAPLPCHAEVIARAWAWARREGLLA